MANSDSSLFNSTQNVPDESPLTGDSHEVMGSPLISFRLSGQQKALYAALAKIESEIAQFYFGSLRVLADGGNPDRLALAAHGIRELMDHLPKYTDLELEALNEKLGDKVVNLIHAWDSMVANSKSHTGSNWTGAIDKPLGKFLKGLEEFVSWFKQHRPKRSDTIKSVLRHFDVMNQPLPAPLENLRAQEWSDLHDYFTGVLHHGVVTNIADFALWMSALERFLLDRLYPRTFDDLAEIDQIVQESNSNG